jgi:hypothetical protein
MNNIPNQVKQSNELPKQLANLTLAGIILLSSPLISNLGEVPKAQACGAVVKENKENKLQLIEELLPENYANYPEFKILVNSDRPSEGIKMRKKTDGTYYISGMVNYASIENFVKLFPTQSDGKSSVRLDTKTQCGGWWVFSNVTPQEARKVISGLNPNVNKAKLENWFFGKATE